MPDLDRVKDQAQRDLWDVINGMALRRKATPLDLRAWLTTLDRVRMHLHEAARDAEHTAES